MVMSFGFTVMENIDILIIINVAILIAVVVSAMCLYKKWQNQDTGKNKTFSVFHYIIFLYREDIRFFLTNKSYISSSEADNSYFSRVRSTSE